MKLNDGIIYTYLLHPLWLFFLIQDGFCADLPEVVTTP